MERLEFSLHCCISYSSNDRSSALHIVIHSLARPEFVGVIPDPEYRGQRLQQHIMDALHARAKDENHLVQVINGINWVSEYIYDDKPDVQVTWTQPQFTFCFFLSFQVL